MLFGVLGHSFNVYAYAIDAARRSHRGDGAGVGRDSRPRADLNNEVMYMCLARVNPVTLAVGNTVKRVVIIAAAMVVLGEAMEPVAMIGTTVAIAGVLLYSILKQRLA